MAPEHIQECAEAFLWNLFHPGSKSSAPLGLKNGPGRSIQDNNNINPRINRPALRSPLLSSGSSPSLSSSATLPRVTDSISAQTSDEFIPFKMTFAEINEKMNEGFRLIANLPCNPSSKFSFKSNSGHSDAERGAIQAPKHLILDTTFIEKMVEFNTHLGEILAQHRVVDRHKIFHGINYDELNQGNVDTLLKFHCAQPAVDILNAACQILLSLPQDRRPKNALADALLKVSNVALDTQKEYTFPGSDKVKTTLGLTECTQATLDIYDLDYALYADADQVEPLLLKNAFSDKELLSLSETLKHGFLRNLCPDQSLIAMINDHGCKQVKFTTLQVKKPEHFCEKNVETALKPESWHHPVLRAQAEKGKLPLRQAIRSLKNHPWCIDPRARYTGECVAQEWKYMAEEGDTYGMLSSALYNVVLRIDWSSNEPNQDVYFYPFKTGQLTVRTGPESFLEFHPCHVATFVAGQNLIHGKAPLHKILKLASMTIKDYDEYNGELDAFRLEADGHDSSDDSDDDDVDNDDADDDDAGVGQGDGNGNGNGGSDNAPGRLSYPYHVEYKRKKEREREAREKQRRYRRNNDTGKGARGGLTDRDIPVSSTDDANSIEVDNPNTDALFSKAATAKSTSIAFDPLKDAITRSSHPHLFFPKEHKALNSIVKKLLRKPKDGHLRPVQPQIMVRALCRVILQLREGRTAEDDPMDVLKTFMPKLIWVLDTIPCAEQKRSSGKTPTTTPPTKRDLSPFLTPSRKHPRDEGEDSPDGSTFASTSTSLFTPPESHKGSSPDAKKLKLESDLDTMNKNASGVIDDKIANY